LFLMFCFTTSGFSRRNLMSIIFDTPCIWCFINKIGGCWGTKKTKKRSPPPNTMGRKNRGATHITGKSRHSNTLKAGYTPTHRRKLGKWKSRPWEWLAASAISLHPQKRKYSFVTVCVYYILYLQIFQVPFAIFLFFLRIAPKNAHFWDFV
jgi:hypothetical protein